MRLDSRVATHGSSLLPGQATGKITSVVPA
jgi:hypothetical protein